MNLQKELEALQHSQHAMEGEYRLCSNGSVQQQTITRSGDIGWKVIAKTIPGAAHKIAAYFEDGYLEIDDIRRAFMIRDMLLTKVIEEQTVTSMEDVIRKQIRKQMAKPKAKRPKSERVASSHLLDF